MRSECGTGKRVVLRESVQNDLSPERLAVPFPVGNTSLCLTQVSPPTVLCSHKKYGCCFYLDGNPFIFEYTNYIVWLKPELHFHILLSLALPCLGKEVAITKVCKIDNRAINLGSH